MASAAPRKYGSLFDDEDPLPLGRAAVASGDKATKFASLFGSDAPGDVKKYPGLFDDDSGRGAIPPAALRKSAPPKNLFDDDDDDGADVPPPRVPATDAGAARDGLPVPPPPPLPAATAEGPPVADDDDESMFEMKYYEERARRVTLEARILQLENTVRLLQGRLGEGDEGAGLQHHRSGEVASEEGSLERSRSGSAPDVDAEDAARSAELEEAARELAVAARERELARRQRQQRRPVSMSARRVGNCQTKPAPAPGSNGITASKSASSLEECVSEGPVEDLFAVTAGDSAAAVESRSDGIPSSILSWSSDEDDAPTIKPSASDSLWNNTAVNGDKKGRGLPVSTDPSLSEAESRAQEEISARRRQKAYRATIGSRPTSRRLGNSKPRTASSATNGIENNAAHGTSGAKQMSSLGGFEKWSDSDEEAVQTNGQVQTVHSSQRRKSRDESFDWDSDTEEAGGGTPAAVVVEQPSILTDEESADRRVVSWARGKDIVTMVRTFRDIYEDSDSLPTSVLNPEIRTPGDVRKAYLKIVKYCHPDKQSKHGGMKHVAPKLFSALTDAYNDFRNQGY